jgi:hypothetical protein
VDRATPVVQSADKQSSQQTKSSTKVEEQVLKDGRALLIETLAPEARMRLKSKRRGEVIGVVKLVLEQGPVLNPPTGSAIDLNNTKGRNEKFDAALEIVAALELHELASVLSAQISTTQSWKLLTTLNRLLAMRPKAFDPMSAEGAYLKRLEQAIPTSDAMLKIALIDGLTTLKSQLGKEIFDRVIADESYEVRQAAVENFLATREKVSIDEQAERFTHVFTIKPYQIRLEAMKRFAVLPIETRSKLKKAVSPKLCESEKNTEVKAACQNLLRGVS